MGSIPVPSTKMTCTSSVGLFFMSENCDILLAGTMGAIAEDVRDSLVAHGLCVELMDFAQNVHKDEFGYRRKLLKTIALCRPRVIMPVGNPLTLSLMRDELPGDIVAAVERPELIRILDSKVAVSRLAAELGIRQPHIYSSPDEVGDRQVVFKRDISFGAQGVHLPWNRKSLDNLIAHQSPGEPYLIEDYIEGEDWSIDVLRMNGFVRSGVYKVLAHHPATGAKPGFRGAMGPSVSRERRDFPELERMALAILDHLDYNGVCGMDFRVDADGVPYFLECNPRFTGGVSSQVSFGFDIPYLLWEKTIEGLRR